MLPTPSTRSRGFTLADCCVLIAAAVLLCLVVAPLLAQKSREEENRLKCASNLRQIALASIIYANTNTRNNGKFPRTYYDPSSKVHAYTGINSAKAFDKEMGPEFKGPKPNDVTASFYHLLRSTDLERPAFVCPSSDATPLPKEFKLEEHSNFPGPEHLAYSYSTPFASKEAIMTGWKLDTTLPPDYPLAADINPGALEQGGPTKTAFDAPAAKMRLANSPNHWFEGQNVVYVDGHVEWHATPFCGAPRKDSWRDNIYANAAEVDAKTGVGGAVHALPVGRTDSVMLPAVTDTAEGAKRTLPVRDPAKAPK